MDVEAVIVRRALDDPAERIRLRGWLQREWFRTPMWGSLFRVVCTHGKDKPTTTAAIQDLVERSTTLRPPAKAQVFEYLGKLVSLGPVADGDFGHSLATMLKEAERTNLFDSMEEACSYLEGGDLESARTLVRAMSAGMAKFQPGENTRRRARTMSVLEIDRRVAEFWTGFGLIDRMTGGLARGETVIWGAYTSEYKTFLICVALCRMLRQGASILYVTLEMKASQIQQQFLSIHANEVIRKQGLRYKAVQSLKFQGDEKEVYDQAVADFDGNPAYGDVEIWEPPMGTSIKDIYEYAETLRTDGFPLDIVVVDHMQYVTPVKEDGRSKARWEGMGDTAMRAKRHAQMFDNGRGVLQFLLWQISRDGKKEGYQRGYYELSDLADTADAERAADVVAWSMVKLARRKENEAKIGLAKNRTGELVDAYKGEFIFANPGFSLAADMTKTEREAVQPEVEEVEQQIEEEFAP